MNAGDLRNRITFQTLERVRDADGDYTDQWRDSFKMWANFEPLKSKDRRTAGAESSEVVARVTVRHREEINSNMRLVYRSKVYELEGDPVPDGDSGREYLTLMVRHGTNHDGR